MGIMEGEAMHILDTVRGKMTVERWELTGADNYR
jgi:hypothetical protein